MKKTLSSLLPLLLVFALLVSCGPEVPPTPDSCAHQWGNWTMTQAPTVEAEGVLTRICALCGTPETAPVAKLDPLPCTHTWGEWVETKAPSTEAVGEESRTCSVCGESETREVPKLDAPTPPPSGDDDTHTYTDFTQDEKALMQSVLGLVLPFAPNDEYVLEQYEDEDIG